MRRWPGAKAAETLRAEGFAGRLVLVGEETERPYERPPLSKGYLLGKDPRDKAFVHDAAWYTATTSSCCWAVRATALDPDAHTVTLDGVEPVRYDKLLLATGSVVRQLDVARHRQRRRPLPAHPARRRRAAATRCATARDVVVVGAGWIGLETAAAAREPGRDRHRRGGRRAAAAPGARRRAGRRLRRPAPRARRATSGSAPGCASSAALGGQLTHVVLERRHRTARRRGRGRRGHPPGRGAGRRRPGSTVDNGIVTDAALRTSRSGHLRLPATWPRSCNPLLGRRIRVEHWANALNGGKAAAKAMLGQDVVYDRRAVLLLRPVRPGHGVLRLRRARRLRPGGLPRRPVDRGRQGPEFLAFWVDADGRVLAGMNVNVWDVQDQIQALVRAGAAGAAVDLDRLADPQVPLETLLSPA